MKKGSISTIILILAFLAGAALLLYPTVSDYWNALHQSKAITEYAGQVANLDSERYQQLWREAERYNQTLQNKSKLPRATTCCRTPLKWLSMAEMQPWKICRP